MASGGGAGTESIELGTLGAWKPRDGWNGLRVQDASFIDNKIMAEWNDDDGVVCAGAQVWSGSGQWVDELINPLTMQLSWCQTAPANRH